MPVQYLIHLEQAVEIRNLCIVTLHPECYKNSSLFSLVLTDMNIKSHVMQEPWVTKQALTLERERGSSTGVVVLLDKL